MRLFAIGDLHLSGAVYKPMDKFGSNWKDHDRTIKEKWIRSVSEEDTVLIPGDISWAMTLDEVMIDLQYIHNLPGNKILIRGNHDYWWKSVTKLNELYKNLQFIQNDYCAVGEYAICGTRGWTCPNDTKFTGHDQKIYEREQQRLKLSLEKAKKDGYDQIIVMTHYPPTNDKLEASGFTDLYEQYDVKQAIYGHLHGKDSFKSGLKGMHNGVRYHLVSSDYIGFDPVQIIL